MKVSIHGSSHLGYNIPYDEILLYSGQAGGICYMPDDFESIVAGDPEKSIGRALGCADSGHHSVFQHCVKTFTFEGIPKLAAMILNNERPYVTSEKSGRYTVMACDGREKDLYDKWRQRFAVLISEEYPQLDEKIVKKLAQENARCIISILTPTTTMDYTVDVAQANYLIRWMRDFCVTPTGHPLKNAIKPWLEQIADAMQPHIRIEGIRDYRGRGLSFFAKRFRREEFGENFSVNLAVSSACAAHLNRSRSLDFEFTYDADTSASAFYIPHILQNGDDILEYLEDMRSVADLYPAGMLLNLNMRGTPENFALLCQERLCGAVLPETCFAVKDVLTRYCSAVFTKNVPVYDFLHRFEHGTKCSFGYYKCNRPCPLGPSMCFERKA